jgi:hypothetical protein
MVTKMEPAQLSRHITLSRLTNTFVPFALLLAAALMVPEAPQILDNHRAIYTIEALVYYRTIYSIWLTIAFMTPALVLFFLPGDSERKKDYWLLCWTFSFLAYLVHFYYTVGVIFHGSLREVYAKQGVIIATSNLVVTAWWAFDLLLAWFLKSRSKWITIERVGAHLYIPLTFFISAVVIKHGVVRVLGILMTLGILISIVLRLIRRKRAAVTARSTLE